MAKMLSHVASTIRGSVGGLTYTSAQGAQIVMKIRSAPVQPNTGPQTGVRSALSQASALWLGLTDAQRQDWELYAQTVTYEGPQGSYTLTGRQIFCAAIVPQILSFTAGTVGQVVVDTPPTIPGRFTAGIVAEGTYTGPGTGVALDISNETSVDGACQLQISQPFNPTRYRYKGPWDTDAQTWQLVPGPATTHIEIDGLTAGMIYFIRTRLVTLDTPARISALGFLRLQAVTVP